MVLYIERWLKAPVQEEDGQLVPREKGTPQGGVISPLLANLFLHYAFDRWMAKQYPQLPFERFADDAIVHCRTEVEAQEVRAAIAARLKECGLELHPEKTKVVYCKDEDRRRTYPNEKFDFLGYTFRPRRSKNRSGSSSSTSVPAVSDKAVKAIRTEIRSWNLHLRSDKQSRICRGCSTRSFEGWLQYYGRFYRSALYPPMRQLDRSLARWAVSEVQEAARAFAQGDALGRAHFDDAIRSCGRTGRWACGVAPWREPYELRGSSTVLREPRGEIPRGYSPCAFGGLSPPRAKGRAYVSLRLSQSESRMLEMGTSGLMSGDGNRGGASASAQAQDWRSAPQLIPDRVPGRVCSRAPGRALPRDRRQPPACGGFRKTKPAGPRFPGGARWPPAEYRSDVPAG
jgi:hypothetical protein